MPPPVQFAAPSALEFFAALVADDDSLPLLEAAIAVAQDEMPGLDVQAALAEVDTLAERLCRRVPADAAPLQRLRLLNQYFFHELGFAGNVNDYHDPRNSLLPEVLRTRRGIPLTLALLYIEIARPLGLAVQGVSFPGHFLVKLAVAGGEVVIDPFTGQSLTRQALEERLLPFRRAPEMGLGAPTLAAWLQAASAREMLARLLRNLREIHRQAGDLPRWLAVQRRLVLVLPSAWSEYQDLALVLARLGLHDEAARALATGEALRTDTARGPLAAADPARRRRAH
ncbi:transglutaminase [Rubrivivax rivuli]|uniref:Transglutaminase n=1 Tax=Rubrivivax rivuli TaxID=1862385 RepID=A0A437RJ09_9BURK|nr:transglutaminase [Rubrivivax rivuli]